MLFMSDHVTIHAVIYVQWSFNVSLGAFAIKSGGWGGGWIGQKVLSRPNKCIQCCDRNDQDFFPFSTIMNFSVIVWILNVSEIYRLQLNGLQVQSSSVSQTKITKRNP
jgi:hypothetical protein